MTKTKVALGVVQETALLTLWARATELVQANPIIADPKAAYILEAIDYDFNKINKIKAKRSQVGTCLRGMVLDNWVRRFLTDNPEGVVVEIGAGLNSRFERVDNGIVHWFDLDLPDMMALRRQFFQSSVRRRLITASALETDWCEQVKALGLSDCMFVAEGVLPYFNEMQVKQLFANLVEHFPGSLLAFDSQSPLAIKIQKRPLNAKWEWSISSIDKIQDWDARYKVVEVCHPADLPARYLKRVFVLTRLLFSYIPPLRDAYRLALVRLG